MNYKANSKFYSPPMTTTTIFDSVFDGSSRYFSPPFLAFVWKRRANGLAATAGAVKNVALL